MGLKISCLGEILLFSNWSSGVSKLKGVTFWDCIMDLLIQVISNCHPEVIKLVSPFSAITISFKSIFIIKGWLGPIVSFWSSWAICFFSVTVLFNTFVDWCKIASSCSSWSVSIPDPSQLFVLFFNSAMPMIVFVFF